MAVNHGIFPIYVEIHCRNLQMCKVLWNSPLIENQVAAKNSVKK